MKDMNDILREMKFLKVTIYEDKTGRWYQMTNVKDTKCSINDIKEFILNECLKNDDFEQQLKDIDFIIENFEYEGTIDDYHYGENTLFLGRRTEDNTLQMNVPYWDIHYNNKNEYNCLVNLLLEIKSEIKSKLKN